MLDPGLLKGGGGGLLWAMFISVFHIQIKFFPDPDPAF